MPRALDRADLAPLAQPGMSIFVGGATAEPTAILAAWREARCLGRFERTLAAVAPVLRLTPTAAPVTADAVALWADSAR